MIDLLKKDRLLYLLIFVLLSCGTDESPSESAVLDQTLEEVLVGVSDNSSIQDFILPEETDFANIPQDEGNPLSEDKVRLGKLLYHETGLGVNPRKLIGKHTYSCASCHFAEAGFQANRQQGIGEGGVGNDLFGSSRTINPLYENDSIDVQPTRSPGVLNSAYQENMLWNGSFGAKGQNVGTEFLWGAGAPIVVNHLGFSGVESQAIGALKVHRLATNPALFDTTEYKTLFESSFPEASSEDLYGQVNVGLAIAAYERTILANRAPFQRWLKGESGAMDVQMKKGAILFFEKANCVACHSGPSLAENEFHALGMEDLIGDDVVVIDTAVIDQIGIANLGRGGFTQKREDNYTFKIPQLYNLKDSPFYGHGGSFNSVREVVEYKNVGIKQNANVPNGSLSTLFTQLNLTDEEVNDLVYFIEEGLYDPELTRYEPNEIPSGFCFPHNDVQSATERGCM